MSHKTEEQILALQSGKRVKSIQHHEIIGNFEVHLEDGTSLVFHAEGKGVGSLMIIEPAKAKSDKPNWNEHDFEAICLTGNGDWFGLNEAIKPHYFHGWKGQEVTIESGQGAFIRHGNITDLINIEQYYEVRPSNESK